ncbi:MAG: hypothetical protein JWM09_302 [Francisellaceae bacterium]|nr:hypothetical protein [Francisellaceae bacterium]
MTKNAKLLDPEIIKYYLHIIKKNKLLLFRHDSLQNLNEALLFSDSKLLAFNIIQIKKNILPLKSFFIIILVMQSQVWM